MSKFIKATNIQYDTDGLKIKKLPKSLIFEVDDDFKPDDDLSDLVSQKTGWCIVALSWQEVKKPA